MPVLFADFMQFPLVEIFCYKRLRMDIRKIRIEVLIEEIVQLYDVPMIQLNKMRYVSDKALHVCV